MQADHSTTASEKRTVFIGSEQLVAVWNARAGNESGVTSVSLTDPSYVIATIGAIQPDVVVIEQAAAAGLPAATLMEHLHDERTLRGTEIRLLPQSRADALMSSQCPDDVLPQAWLILMAHALPPRPQRRAARIRVTTDEQALVDGQPVALIDLSAVGAQVLSETVLKPRQRIRLILPPERGSVKAVAVVAWSTFEIRPTPSYRAGVAFTKAIPTLA